MKKQKINPILEHIELGHTVVRKGAKQRIDSVYIAWSSWDECSCGGIFNYIEKKEFYPQELEEKQIELNKCHCEEYREELGRFKHLHWCNKFDEKDLRV